MDQELCVCDDFCHCKLVGMWSHGSLRVMNGQGWHHLGNVCANSATIWGRFHRVFKCNCQHSRVHTHYPANVHTKRTMSVHMAIRFIRSVIAMLARALRRGSQFVSRNYSKAKKASMQVFLTKGRLTRRRKQRLG